MTEFGLIDYLRQHFADIPSNGFEGIGDDCAIYPMANEQSLVVSCDALCEDIHFIKSQLTAADLARKALTVNLSDIAAMGARPIASMLALTLPKESSEEWIKEFIDGYHSLSLQYGVPLIGGDTTASKSGIMLAVTIFGIAPDANIKRRSAAKVGDAIMVTGTLGESAAGLEDILSGRTSTSAAHCHLNPPVQVEEGIWLGEQSEVHAMMDISDGIASDMRHIMKASGVGAVIALDRLPYSSHLRTVCAEQNWDIYELATGGGEDFELLLTGPDGLDKSVEFPLFAIGRIVTGDDLVWTINDEPVDSKFVGYKHF